VTGIDVSLPYLCRPILFWNSYMRPLPLALLALLAVSRIVDAHCADTLRLETIEVYSQRLKNSATLKEWTRTTVDPWDFEDAKKALPRDSGSFTTSAINHPLRFQTDCGSDFVSNLLFLHVFDSSTWTKSGIRTDLGNFAALDSEAYEMRSYGKQTIGETEFEAIWTNPFVWVTKSAQRETLEGYVYTFSFATHYPGGGRDFSSKYFDLSLEATMKRLADSLANHSPSIDSLKSNTPSVGNIDSTWANLHVYRYVYSIDSSARTAIRNRTSRPTSWLRSTGDGWVLEFDRERAVSLIAPDGTGSYRIGRGQKLTWNGRLPSGEWAHRGVWILQVEGLGSRSLLVP